jgi:hypothetical protein
MIQNYNTEGKTLTMMTYYEFDTVMPHQLMFMAYLYLLAAVGYVAYIIFGKSYCCIDCSIGTIVMATILKESERKHRDVIALPTVHIY